MEYANKWMEYADGCSIALDKEESIETYCIEKLQKLINKYSFYGKLPNSLKKFLDCNKKLNFKFN